MPSSLDADLSADAPTYRFTGVVAIDGPSGSGKSTVASRLASILSARYLDTGAMYRAVTLAVLRAGVSVGDTVDADAVQAVLERSRVEIGTDPGGATIRLDGERVDREIRSEEVSAAVSAVSAVPGVRTELVARQREIASTGGIVIEGRDITTVVAPDADVRVLLTAREDVRAARRGAETGTDVRTQADALRRRDALDAATSGFEVAADDDVLVLDSTELGVDEVVERLLAATASRTDAGPVRPQAVGR